MKQQKKQKNIVVVGGGISGLSAAFYLARGGADVTIVEASDRLGGKINTLRRDGFIIERGPDSFLARKQPMIDLAVDLGIEHELVGTNPAAKKTYIVHGGTLHAMPQGLQLGIPTELMPLARTKLLTWRGKLRALLDFVLPARRGSGAVDDESIGSFMSRRLGAEVTERVVEPLLAGIYAGDLARISLGATFPQFRAAELRHGSLIRGMRAGRGKVPAIGGVHAAKLPAVANTVFLTWRRGLTTVIEALEQKLRELGAAIKLSTAVTKLSQRADGSGYTLETANGETIEADVVVLALPSHRAGELLAEHLDGAHASFLREMYNVSVANLVLGYRLAELGEWTADGSGFVIARSEGTAITACTWTSTKWLHTAPDDSVLVRCYVGRRGDEAFMEQSDDDIVKRVREDLRTLMNMEAEPAFVELTRLPQSMPQYEVGHVEKMMALRAELAAKLPGVYAIGAPLEGVGLPDCVRMARDVAKQFHG